MDKIKYAVKNPITWIGWLTIILAAWSVIWNTAFESEGLLNFRYFTNQTTLLIGGVIFISLSPYKHKPWFSYLAGLALVSGVLTGLTFHFILDVDRPISLQGHLAHTYVPFLYLIYYYATLPGYSFKRFYWLLAYPILYLLIFIITGPFTGFYPYWFLDIETEGLISVLRFTLGLMLPGFSLLSIGLLFLKQKWDQRHI